MSKYLAVIPARGGSKRLPRKNVLNICEKPLIAWSIEASLNSNLIDKTLVTSDDEEILDISKKYGAETIKRPHDISNDTATTYEAIEHAINALEIKYDYIVLLQPTSPLRGSKHIDEAIKLLEEKNADAIVSVCEVEHPVQWSMTLKNDNDMSEFVKNIDSRRSQEQEKHYRLNGAIYICKTDKLVESKSFFLKDNIFAYIMNKEDSIDIDEELDFKLASLILSSRKD
ncbi:cytidylyltransferase domain-containing protein [Sulfurimonas sp.]|uniref:acylneuraminate cytidylyltransferase family protein n=1 Tax=Sulfurimonas sp. TaxID=2022749 RepID=UPI00356AC55E